jgi:hypothetical protein
VVEDVEVLIEGLPTPVLEQSTPLFALRRLARGPALVFARRGSPDNHDLQILYSTRSGWRLAQLPEGLDETTWIFVSRSADGQDLWAIAEGDVGGRGPDLHILAGTNGGRAWSRRATLRKISRFAALDAFAIDPEDDRGSLILRLDEDPSPDAPRLGYYLYLMKNGGRTWSEPIYSHGRPPMTATAPPAPDQTYEYQEPPGLPTWRGLLSALLPPE